MKLNKKITTLLITLSLVILPFKTHAFANLWSVLLVKASSQYADIASNLGYTGGNATISHWFKLTNDPNTGGEAYWIMQLNNSTDSTDISLSIDQGVPPANVLQCKRKKVSVGDQALNYNVAAGLGTTVWHMATCTYDGSNLRLYLDGTLVGGPTSATLTGVGGNNSYTVGREVDEGDPGYFMRGRMDDGRIWSRVLDATEIGNLYTVPCTFNNGANLLAWYLLENDYTDSSGGGFTLTSHGTPAFSSTVPYVCASAVPYVKVPDIINF